MDDSIRSNFAQWNLEPGADPVVVAAVADRLGADLPPDYRAFLLHANGGEGFVRDGGYLRLWPIDEIENNNDQLEVSQSAPGLVFFGTDGGGEGYAFDTRVQPPRIVQVPLVGMSDENTWIEQGHTLAELVDRISKQ
jgi:SMI1 / KNR4 family (SUKH-1)